MLTTSYPREDEDPAGAFVAGFCRWLATHVGEVEVICADPRRSLFYRGGAPSALSAARRWPEAVGFSAALFARAAQRIHRWDALVSHWLVPCAAVGTALAASGRRVPRPHLAICHGSDARLLARLPLGGAFARRLAVKADLVYVARALTLSGAAGRVVPMGIDAAGPKPTPEERGAARRALALEGFTVLYLGRLTHEKGADLLLDALPPGAKLLIAGEGPERDRLKRAARGRPVRLLGEVRGPAKRRVLMAADVLAVPSRLDGAPTVVAEAHAAGLPVVASRVGGLPELLRDGEDGLLCDGSSAAFKQVLERLARDPARTRALAAAGRAASAARDWSNVGPQLGRLLVGLPTGLTPGRTIKIERV